MKRLFFAASAAFAALILSACVDVKIRSELPKLDYFALDSLDSSTQNCGAFTQIALHKFDIPQKYATKNLLLKSGDKISNIEGANLADNLASELENIAIKAFSARCIKVILPPFSGINAEVFLRVKMLDFIALEGENLARTAFVYQMHQNGAILQSGIIKAEREIADFSDSAAIFGAMKRSAIAAINELASKIEVK